MYIYHCATSNTTTWYWEHCKPGQQISIYICPIKCMMHGNQYRNLATPKFGIYCSRSAKYNLLAVAPFRLPPHTHATIQNCDNCCSLLTVRKPCGTECTDESLQHRRRPTHSNKAAHHSHHQHRCVPAAPMSPTFRMGLAVTSPGGLCGPPAAQHRAHTLAISPKASEGGARPCSPSCSGAGSF